MRRVLNCTRFFYLDSSSGASIANRALMECLARRGFGVEVLCGTVVDAASGDDPVILLADQDRGFRAVGDGEGDVWMIGGTGVRTLAPPHLSGIVGGVPVTTLHRPLLRNGAADLAETGELLSLFDSALARFRPDVVVTYGGDRLTLEILSRARRHGAATVFTLHNFGYPVAAHFADVDAILVPSRFSADYHQRAVGIDCVALPYLIDAGRARAERSAPGYVTFVNASAEKGVYAFVRIADELGRRRPDIPLLVVESRGTEATLVNCGIDLRPHGNVFLMAQTPDPRDFWKVTRVCLMPSLWWESQGLVAVEAMINGIPVVASDRGALPETLGDAGIALPLPERLTPFTRELPTPAEVDAWVKVIVRLWDDEAFYSEQSRRALVESRRWSSEELEPRYVQFFREVRSLAGRSVISPTETRLPSATTPPIAPDPPRSWMRHRREFGSFLNERGLLGTGVEIGVQNGNFSRLILDHWRGELLYLVDIWQPLEGYRDVANVDPDEQVERIVRTIRNVAPHWPRVRLIQETSENAARLVRDGSLDWVYIDANHDYRNVLRDLSVWVPKVREGGLIAGHDYLDGVLVIDGIETVFAVKRAVLEFFGGPEIPVTEEGFPTWFVTKS